jgi:RluA family pseudouridine synthase
MLGVSVARFSLTLEAGDEGRRLDEVLARWLPSAVGRPLSKSSLRRLVMAGAVTVDGRPRRRPGLPLARGQRVHARVDAARLGFTPTTAAPLAVLYRDEWLLAVTKPAGLQVHASADPTRPDLFTILRRQLAGDAVAEGEGLPYLALHHRLDIDTSGVIVFASAPEANRGLAEAFGEHRVEKVYEAITGRAAAAPAGRWTARGPLAPVGTGRAARVRVVAGGQTAETSFAVVRRYPDALLVEARPATGRKHQVRAHLSDAGLPIAGDARYGGPPSIGGVAVPRTMLHAARLRFSHPVTGAPLDIRCPRPDDFQHLIDRLEQTRR